MPNDHRQATTQVTSVDDRFGTHTLEQLAPAQADTQPPHVINLADYQVRRRPFLDGLTSEYQIAA